VPSASNGARASHHGADLPQPEAGDQFPGFGERAIDELAPRAVEAHPRAAPAGVKALASQHDPGLHQSLVVGAHRRQLGLGGHHPGLGIRRRLHDHHHFHRTAFHGCGPDDPLHTWYDEPAPAGSTTPPAFFMNALMIAAPPPCAIMGPHSIRPLP